MPKKSNPGFSTGPFANTLITYSFLHHNNSQGQIWTFNPKHYRFGSCLGDGGSATGYIKSCSSDYVLQTSILHQQNLLYGTKFKEFRHFTAQE